MRYVSLRFTPSMCYLSNDLGLLIFRKSTLLPLKKHQQRRKERCLVISNE